MSLLPDLSEAIDTALRAEFGRCSRHGECWTVTTECASRAPVDLCVSVADGWLILDLPLAPPRADAAACAVALVELNRQLPGQLKIAVTADSPEPRLRSELPLHADEPLGRRLESLHDALLAGRGLVDHGTAASARAGDPARPEATAPSLGEARSLAEACAEAGWQTTARTTGELVVELSVPNDFRQAELRPSGAGFSASLRLEPTAVVSQACESAVATLLLRLGGWVRLVRGVATTTNGQRVASFEVGCDRDRSPRMVAECLSALSVAARWCAAECEAVQRDPKLAGAYLAYHAPAAARVATAQSTGEQWVAIPF